MIGELAMPRDWTLALLAGAITVAGCSSLTGTEAAMPRAGNETPNPLLAPWTGAFDGVPPFDRASVALLGPALEAAMAMELAEIDAIAASPEPATFDNTIAALERAGRAKDRVDTIYGIYASSLSTPEFQVLERQMAPRLAAHRDRINQNEPLFRRIEALYNSPGKARLTPEQQRLVWLRYTDLVLAGARLGPAEKQQVAAINERLAALFTTFNQNILAEEGAQMLVLEDAADLAGLAPAYVASAAAAAAERKLAGKWIVANTRSSVEPFLTYSPRRDLREKVWRSFVNRGDNGDAHDNNAIISEILALRARRARLLGFETHAHWRLQKSMAKTPERALELMQAVWTPAVARVHEEVAGMQAIADAEGDGLVIEPWDYRYYAEKVREAKYDLDEQQIKPYLQLESLREGMFWTAGQLYGLQFIALEPGSVPVYHPDVRVWQVRDRDGRHVGLYYFDPFLRSGKRSGAWMNAYRAQERFDGEVTTIVSNNLNFVEPPPGQPALLSLDDAHTLFHEFGHAVHGLLSSVDYPSVAGTAVVRDFVELPSQLMEHWLTTREVLDRYARHYQTGQPMPQDLLERIKRAETFNQGFATVEYLSAALVDMKLHLAGGTPIDPDAFERKALAEIGMPHEIVMRHRTPQFSHVFSSDSYSAGYYSYLWADKLVADTWEAFLGAGGPWDQAVAKRLRDALLSVGNSVDPDVAYRAFRGRDATVDPLLRKRGFPVPAPRQAAVGG
jgi:peptidyl-dipeptidase Dcp